MNTNGRDDFQAGVKRLIALRVNYCCSNPECGAPTSGPSSELEKALNIGVSAHITAASPGGPRYDSNLSSQERASASNAIWLCQNCAKLVDNDPLRYNETFLREWKTIAEKCAHIKIGRQSPFDSRLAPELTVLKNESECGTIYPFTAELPGEELIEVLKKLIPEDMRNSEDITQTELLDRGHGAFGQPYAILAVGMRHGSDWVIIFFVAGEFGWEIIAQTSFSDQKGWVPSVYYIPGAPGALTLDHVVMYGTEVFARSTSWYRIKKGRAIPLLTYPLEFYVNGWDMPFDRELKSKVISIPERLQMGMALEVDYTIEYTIGNRFLGGSDDSRLFSTKHRLSLEWNDLAGTLLPRGSNDDLSKIDALWNEDTDGFVTRNLATLQLLATNGTPLQRHFIRDHLFFKGEASL